MSTTTAASGNVFPVDVEHIGIRIVLPVVMLVVGIGLWLSLSAPLESLIYNASGTDGLGAIASGVAGLAGAVVAGVIADYLMKRYWPSGRTLVLHANQITATDTRKGHPAETTIHLDQPISATPWRFTVKRSTPKAQNGWQMLAVQLAQDDTALIVYSFMPPKQAQALPVYEQFTEMLPPKAVQDGKLPVRAIAEQRRLMRAEATRWEAGCELRAADFIAFSNFLTPHLKAWQPETP